MNWHEPGAEALAAALMERGVGVEAGIWARTDAAGLFARSPLAPKVLRVLAEVISTEAGTHAGTDAASAPATARELLAALAGTAPGRPVLLHGMDDGAWPVLRLAGALGLDTRIGLEDTLLLPDGRPARDNAELIRAAAAAMSGSACGA